MKQRVLISFKSGHYKEFVGEWKGDSVWGHYVKEDGSNIHINKDEIEYIQTWPVKEGPSISPDMFRGRETVK